MNCYLVGSGNRDLNNPLNWSSTSGGSPADVLGSELITNGGFDTDANWVKTAGWTISGGTANFIANGSFQYIRQATSVAVGKWTKCTFTVSNYIAGKVKIQAGNGGSGAWRTSNGTFTEYMKATDSFLYIYADPSFIGSIDNVSFKEVLSVPNSSNPAIIDANSSIANGDVLSLSAQFDCCGFDCSAAAYTFTLSNAAYAFNIYGDLKDSVKRVNGFSSTGYLYIKGNCNIYSNGATQGWNRIYFDAVGATFTNQDDMNVGSTQIYLTNGTWATNDKTISIGYFFLQAGTKTLNLGASVFNVTMGAFSSSERDGFTFIAGTSTVNIFVPVTHNFSGNVIFYNLSFQAYTDITLSYRLQSNCSVSNVLSINGYNAGRNRTLIASNTIGTPRTITCNGSIVASNVDFRDITLAGTADRDLSAISGGSGDCGGNSGITFTPAIDCYIKHTSGAMNVSDATKWVTTDGGTTQARVPLMQDRSWGTANSFTGAATINMNCPRIGSIDLSGVNQAVTFSLANNIECYGNYVLGNNIIPSITRITTLLGRDNYFINTYNKTIQGPFYITAFNSFSYTFLSDFTSTTVLGVNVYNYNLFGEVKFNNYNITAGVFEAYKSPINLGNGILRFNSGTPSGGFIFRCTGEIYPGNSTIIIEPSGGSNEIIFRNFGTGIEKSFNKVILSGFHTGNFVISDNNIFNELIIEKGRKVQITGGSTQTISPTGKLTADGTPTEQIQITSTNTTPFNLVYAGTGFHQVNYCNISYCNATDNRFYAGKNSTDGGNNKGWIFRNYLTKYTTIVKRKLKLIN